MDRSLLALCGWALVLLLVVNRWRWWPIERALRRATQAGCEHKGLARGLENALEVFHIRHRSDELVLDQHGALGAAHEVAHHRGSPFELANCASACERQVSELAGYDVVGVLQLLGDVDPWRVLGGHHPIALL